MNAFDAVRQCADNAGIPVYQIGLSMGKSKNYMSQGISRGSTPKADTLARMLDVCGFGLFAIPYGHEPNDAIQITANDD